MHSVLDQIASMCSETKKTTSWKISSELIKFYKNKQELPNLVTLANSCFVSPSMITKFSKNLGFNGYKELSVKMQIEIIDRSHKNISTIFDNSNSLFKENEINAINTIRDFQLIKEKFNSLINLIKNANKIYIFSTNYFSDVAKLMNIMLLSKGINVVYMNKLNSMISIFDNISKKDLCLFFIGGSGSDEIKFYFQQLYNKFQVENIFLFCTHSKIFKFNYPNNSIIIDTDFLSHNFFERTFSLSYIIMQIDLHLN
ncbi:hypothetical protein EELLY_v1c02790 [Entomoplasma ellychniae]|uniref:HTH rpiR-type domain-containing protein n=1 Tax=Entomoplasma ellychniae TaxID=2114 RepID=A0A8E2QYH0_9MOLU|nr:MurR/RpiR family transcriptional regulator [Entomoplasma ellychniae]PPE04599.1 hypothetical protein EELLY_v1c02790 [Entomoplasma ellychniae]